MDFISVAEHAEGFIAIGQEARGVIAIGQVATGVVAIGQLARGCFALGQLGFGFIGWGQAGFGLLHAVGMVGVGGRGFGIVIPLVPSVGRRRVPPETIELERALSGEPGWVLVDLFFDDHGLGLASNSRRLPVKFDRRLYGGANALTTHGSQRVWAYLTTRRGVVVCERIVHAPRRPYENTAFYVWGALGFAGLVIMATLWWKFVGGELLQILDRVL